MNAAGMQKHTDVYAEALVRVLSDQGPVPTAWLQRNDEEREEVGVDCVTLSIAHHLAEHCSALKGSSGVSRDGSPVPTGDPGTAQGEEGPVPGSSG